MLSIGLMSGTSMDGIDAALLETNGTPSLIRELGHTSLRYDHHTQLSLKIAEYTVRTSLGDMQQAQSYYPTAIRDYLKNELNMTEADIHPLIDKLPPSLDDVIQLSTKLHLEVTKKLLIETGYQPQQIDVVGYHGQAMFHRPSIKKSIIVGNGQYLADQLGITVVDDFRSRDVAAGGQGAPFAPLYHQALAIKDKRIPLAVLNCGGIANITLIQNDNELDLIGFDTGPGNGLIDRLVRQRTQGKENMDRDGRYGKKGKAHEQVLTALYEKAIIKNGKNYFAMVPPKSLDIGDMHLVPELDNLSIEDACRTLEVFTANTIIKSLDLIHSSLPTTWILAGGGWHNPVIRETLSEGLQQKLKKVDVLTADEAGWNSDAMEAQIFAYLAVRCLQNQPLSFPNTTRAPEPLSGGRIHRPHSLFHS